MKLLFVIDDYLPDSTRVSPKMVHELAVYLNGLGHNIVVLTPGSKNQEDRLAKSTLDGIEIWRFKSGPVKDISRVKRLINESLLSFNAWLGIRSEASLNQFEGIIYYSPSIFFGPLIGWLRNKCSCCSYLILRDLFPQWAIDAGIIGHKSPIALYFKFFEHLNYRFASKIGLMSNKNIEVFDQVNPGYSNLEVLPNWVSPAILENTEPYWRKRLKLDDKVIYLYGGNIGSAQDMPNLLRLAKKMQHKKQAHFLFVGQGDEYNWVSNFIEINELTNTTLLPSISQEQFKDLLAEVDVGLFSLAKDHTAHNFPGKILGYIAYSLPILGSVNPGNDLKPIILENRAGFVYDNGEDEHLFEAANLLAESFELRKTLGANARLLLDSHFSVVSVANKILASLGGGK